MTETKPQPNWPAIEAALFRRKRGLIANRLCDEKGGVCAMGALYVDAGVMRTPKHKPMEGFAPWYGCGRWPAELRALSDVERHARSRAFFGICEDGQYHIVYANNNEPNPKLRPIRALNALRAHYGLPPRPDDWRPIQLPAKPSYK